MRALLKIERGNGHVELRDDWPEPTAKPGWVVATVNACGICGTDLHIWHDQHKYWPPVVLGHEYVVTIASLGEGVDGWSVGERAVCEQHSLACGRCYSCRRGAIHLCPEKRSPGWGIDGAFAERVALPAHLLHRVPEGVPDEAAVVTEPLAICVTGIDRAAMLPGETALVIGPGAVGLLTAMVLRGGGARVILAGRPSSAARLALAASLGLETAAADAAACADRIGAADVVFEASGSAEGLALAVGVTRRQGRVICLGLSGADEVTFPADEAMRRSLDIRFSMSSEYSAWDRALALLRDRVVVPQPIVTTYPLDCWRDAFEALARRDVIKAALLPA